MCGTSASPAAALWRMVADLFNESLGEANRPIGRCVNEMAIAYGSTCGRMATWLAVLSTVID